MILKYDRTAAKAREERYCKVSRYAASHGPFICDIHAPGWGLSFDLGHFWEDVNTESQRLLLRYTMALLSRRGRNIRISSEGRKAKECIWGRNPAALVCRRVLTSIFADPQFSKYFL